MKVLDSHLQGAWQTGQGEDIPLYNPATGQPVVAVRRAGELGSAVAYGREVGGAALRALSFAERGALLEAMSKVIYEHRDALIDIAIANGGNTRGDAKFDIDGATAVLAKYAEIAKELGHQRWFVDGDQDELYRGSKIKAQHVCLPRHGLAIHINAFNFPAWGMIGKAAVALLAGMPVLSKPATSSAHLAHRIVELIVEAKILPEGAFQLLMGSAGDLLDHVDSQDVVAFTGSARVGNLIKTHEAVVARGVRVNIEADSLNSVIVGPDVESGTELYDLIIRDCTTEMTQKAGQKCTATRRILVPEGLLEELRETLCERLADQAAITGDPSVKRNRMGPLATAGQLKDAREGVAKLSQHAKIVRGDPQRDTFNDVEPGQGCFLEPILLEATAEAALDATASFHAHEVFGPVATLLPYDGQLATTAKIIALGRGSLVTTVYSDDRGFLADAVADIAPHLGRLVVASEKVAGASMSPGAVFAAANHGGPGRAGGGAELGGKAGLALYMQRTAIQGGASQLARLLTPKE